MKTLYRHALLSAVLLWSFCAVSNASELLPLPPELTNRLVQVIQKHCPEATFEVVGHEFFARNKTLMFTLHSRYKTGEISTNTFQAEGPNHKGFLLRVSLRDGKYAGAAVRPQTLAGPYFPTFLDAVEVDEGRKHFLINFSYGGHIDRELRTAILENMPASIRGQREKESTD